MTLRFKFECEWAALPGPLLASPPLHSTVGKQNLTLQTTALQTQPREPAERLRGPQKFSQVPLPQVSTV